MGQPFDHPPSLHQSHFNNFILIFSVATYVRWRLSRQSEKANPPTSKPDKIKKTMPGANSHHQRKPGRNAKQKQEFRRLVLEVKRVACEHRYTRRDLALELGVSVAAINQWWIGYTPLAKPEHVERLKDFLEKRH